jgi:spore germination protein GerM
MPKQESKKKNKAQKHNSRKTSWIKLFTAFTIAACVIIYFSSKYGYFSVPIDPVKRLFQKQDISANLYFADPHSDYLVREQRKLPKKFTQNENIQHVVEELIKGPKRSLIRTVPESTIIKNVRVDRNGIAWLDFSSHLSKDHPGGSSAEIITVYSIANTVILNFKDVKKVRFLIDGAEIETLAGHIDCRRTIVANKDYIKR